MRFAPAVRIAAKAAPTVLLCAAALAGDSIHWHSWDDQLFAQAKREHRFVILDLEAVWCHWCHVMDQTTYADPAVIAELGAHYLPVRVDQDANPDLSNRYGDWGWPATIVFAPDGSEIVKRRGYLAPEQMLSMLKAIVADPTPGPSVQAAADIAAATTGVLTPSSRKTLEDAYVGQYDDKAGGWSDQQKFIDAAAMELALERARRGDGAAERRARQTLTANLQLIDPVWGGVFQYSATPDWKQPHFEKLVSYQSDDLRLYAQAGALWHEPAYREAARRLREYLAAFLAAPDGGFYVSQDADLSATVTGHEYYALDNPARRKLGVPRVDQHRYARENGWAIVALARDADLTGNAASLEAAVRAADWVVKHRSLAGGGFRHAERDRGGPFLADTLAMGEAFLALHRSTGGRDWLKHAVAALDFVAAKFRDPRGGFFTAQADAHAAGVFREPLRLPEENIALARLANLAWHYTGEARLRAIADHAMRYLSAPALIESRAFLPGLLLADRELGEEPVHVAIVGGKGDPAAQALQAAARRYPTAYLRVDWWDRAEGPLPNPDVQYPELPQAAAFACAGHACSRPLADPAQIQPTVDKLRAATEPR